jgi:tripartite-type tricarboxylate transporter receptor subunit TctC
MIRCDCSGSWLNRIYEWLVIIALICSAAPARADGVADFYKGKTITIQVGYGVGGGYDLVARVIAQFYGKYIPGNPHVIVENVPSAGGLKVANSIYNTVAKGGLTLGVFVSNAALEPLFGNEQAKFDATKFAWIGSMDTDLTSCAVWKGAGVGIGTLSDLLRTKKTISFGSTSETAPTSLYPLFFKKALSAPIKVINGYAGTSDIMIAMQRGEVAATCGLFESSVRGSFLQYLKAGDLKPFVQITLGEKSPLFGDATPILEAVPSDDMRKIAQLVFGPSILTRPLAAPPGTPGDRVAALRTALLETAADKEAMAAAQSVMGAALHPKSGEEVSRLMAEFVSTSPELVKKAFFYTHD